MKIGYARSSTKEQSLSMQIDALNKAGCDQIHEEIASGAKTARPVLEEIMRNLRFEEHPYKFLICFLSSYKENCGFEVKPSLNLPELTI